MIRHAAWARRGAGDLGNNPVPTKTSSWRGMHTRQWPKQRGAAPNKQQDKILTLRVTTASPFQGDWREALAHCRIRRHVPAAAVAAEFALAGCTWQLMAIPAPWSGAAGRASLGAGERLRRGSGAREALGAFITSHIPVPAAAGIRRGARRTDHGRRSGRNRFDCPILFTSSLHLHEI